MTSTILFAGSEAARGIPKMGIARPDMETSSEAEFRMIANGQKFGPKADPLFVYSYIKLAGTHWMASMARQHPHIRFVTMSPGGTAGTNGMDDLPFLKKVFFKYIGGTLMPLPGMMHSVEKGAKRYVDGLLNPRFESGHFYASRAGYPTGPVVDQVTLDGDLATRASRTTPAARCADLSEQEKEKTDGLRTSDTDRACDGDADRAWYHVDVCTPQNA